MTTPEAIYSKKTPIITKKHTSSWWLSSVPCVWNVTGTTLAAT